MGAAIRGGGAGGAGGGGACIAVPRSPRRTNMVDVIRIISSTSRRKMNAETYKYVEIKTYLYVYVNMNTRSVNDVVFLRHNTECFSKPQDDSAYTGAY
jgi:hypothetical protein